MNSIQEIIKYILESNIINFCLMAWLLVWICRKINIKSAFNNAIKSVEDYIKKSEIEKQNSDELIKESEKLIAQLPQNIQKIEEFNKQKSETFKKQIAEHSEKSISDIENNIQKVLSVEEKTLSNEITRDVVVNSIEQSKNRIIKMLQDKPNLRYKFIDKSLEELDRIKL